MPRVFVLLLLLLVGACASKDCDQFPDGLDEAPSIEVQRLEKQLFLSQSKEEVLDFLSRENEVANYFLHNQQYPDDSILASRMFGLINDPFIDTLKTEAEQAFGNGEKLGKDLNGLYAWMKYYFPETKIPQVKTMITGIYNDLYIGDDLLVIGIDFFIGPEATYKPLNVPYYIQRRYTPEHLPAIIAKFLAGGQIRTGQDNTLLSEMIDYGKINYLVKRLLPCKPDSIIMGYTSEEMRIVNKNQEVIWANFVEKQLLYETDEFTKQKYLGERPNIYEISKQCPGRVGSWLGWEIVEKYMAEKELSITALLDETDHHKIFSESGYKPVNR